MVVVILERMVQRCLLAAVFSGAIVIFVHEVRGSRGK